MIGKLKGIVDTVEEEGVLLDVRGVCYHAFCSARTLRALAPGEAAELVIETHVREDHLHLFGFPNTAERDWFRLLTTVQRVGNKMALAILDAHPPAQLAHAILARDTTAFSRISGIGPKLAERIVTELKDKVGGMPVESEGTRQQTGGRSKTKPTSHQPPATSHLEDAVSALTHLGYARTEAYAAASAAAREAGAEAPVDALIRLSLRELA
jgi:Holliday junction DNA helicase RuvA